MIPFTRARAFLSYLDRLRERGGDIITEIVPGAGQAGRDRRAPFTVTGSSDSRRPSPDDGPDTASDPSFCASRTRRVADPSPEADRAQPARSPPPAPDDDRSAVKHRPDDRHGASIDRDPAASPPQDPPAADPPEAETRLPLRAGRAASTVARLRRRGV